LAWYKKTTKPNTTKACINQSKEMYYATKEAQKLKPGLIAFYDIRPGNDAGLFAKKKISKGGENNWESYGQDFSVLFLTQGEVPLILC